jgi:quercetin dioxygenase-like cupin family protein
MTARESERDGARRISASASLKDIFEGATQMKIYEISCAVASKFLRALPFAAALLVAVLAGFAQAPKQGVVRPLSEVKFAQDDDVKCLVGVPENGNPDSGPSTFLLKAAPNCVVAPHYHTAEEQLLVVRGDVSTGMEGMRETVLSSGGFAMMASKQTHWFTCKSNDGCLMFVTFDRTYDIVWVKQGK